MCNKSIQQEIAFLRQQNTELQQYLAECTTEYIAAIAKLQQELRESKQLLQSNYQAKLALKASQVALVENEAKYRNLVENISDLIFSMSLAGSFTYVSPQYQKVLGWEPAELLGKPFAPLVHPDDLLIAQQNIEEMVANNGKQAKIQFRHQRKDGSWCWMRAITSPILNSDGEMIGFHGVLSDMSDRQQIEAQLRQQAEDLAQTLQELQRTQSQMIQAEKMSSLGQLVAGVAHEINNPVNFIYGNLYYLQEHTQNLLRVINFCQLRNISGFEALCQEIDLEYIQEDLPKILHSMNEGTQRISQIVLSLRTFSRMDEAEFKVVDIHEGLDSTLMILQHRLKEKPGLPEICVIKNYGSLPLVECFAGQLNQVFMNILVNAIDAIEAGVGSGEWGVGKENQSPRITIGTSLIDSGWVKIAIADNGMGMPEHIQKQIFNPFFTTKPVGQGTGMGMSISYQIVTEKHKGKLDCYSKPGEGTEFVITIPTQH